MPVNTQRDDTTHNVTFEEYVRIAASEGFEVIVSNPFKGHGWGDKIVKDELYVVMWHPDGFLLTVESFNTDKVNTARLYYNINLTFEEYCNNNFTSSGGFYVPRSEYRNEDYQASVWNGDHEVTTGLRYKFHKLRPRALKVWKKQPHLWLINYMDLKDENGRELRNWLGSGITDRIRAEMIARMPEHVQAAIKGVDSE